MTRKSIADMAYTILEDNHYPMHYRKITEKILKVKNITAEKPHHAVNALMGVDNRFIKYQRGIWGLIKWKYREANLPYTLTSYCLLNGTIFLTSYLKPYFSWHHNDQNNRTIEITFVDSDGEIITAELNYHEKKISGFKEWFKKKDLEVNDSILIGLVDQNKKIYFILAEKETGHDVAKKDLGDMIYQILNNENNPLTFFQIHSEITRREGENTSLLKSYIENILENDSRFIFTDSEEWSLVDWMDEEDRIYHNLSFADNLEDFVHSLSICFEYFGYKIEQAKAHPKKMFIARAELASKSYSLLISGLPKNHDINTIHSIDWSMMKDEKERMKADTVIMFSENFTIPELINRAGEEGVLLYDLSILDYIIREHYLIPFSMLDFRIVFNPINNPQKNLVNLKRKREKNWDNWFLIKRIVNILQSAKTRNTHIDINLLIEEISHKGNQSGVRNIESARIKRIISILNQEPFGLIELSESGIITLIYPDHLVQEKINNIWQFIMGEY